MLNYSVRSTSAASSASPPLRLSRKKPSSRSKFPSLMPPRAMRLHSRYHDHRAARAAAVGAPSLELCLWRSGLRFGDAREHGTHLIELTAVSPLARCAIERLPRCALGRTEHSMPRAIFTSIESSTEAAYGRASYPMARAEDLVVFKALAASERYRGRGRTDPDASRDRPRQGPTPARGSRSLRGRTSARRGARGGHRSHPRRSQSGEQASRRQDSNAPSDAKRTRERAPRKRARKACRASGSKR